MIRPGLWRRELTIPLQSIQAELNRLFEEYWQVPGAAASGPTTGAGTSSGPGRTATGGEPEEHGGTSAAGAAVWSPMIDLWEAPDELTLVVDLPGVDPSTVDLSLTGNILAIRGTRVGSPAGATAESTRSRVRERPTGSFYRQVTLVDEVDFDRVEAQAKDGVLTVRLPKRDSGQARTIPIRPARG